jgi:hypothetical protein
LTVKRVNFLGTGAASSYGPGSKSTKKMQFLLYKTEKIYGKKTLTINAYRKQNFGALTTDSSRDGRRPH